jgi:GGDEF domain-containing protein
MYKTRISKVLDMAGSRMTLDKSCSSTFIQRVEVELNRAERYRVFVSLTVFDLGPVREIAGDKNHEVLTDVSVQVRELVRACDYVALLHDHCLAVLQPETPRQGAEIAAKRLATMVKDRLVARLGEDANRAIPVEIASFPDTAGARTLNGFLEELAQKSQN